MSEWGGVITDNNGRVIEIEPLQEPVAAGRSPAELSNLANLENLWLSGNRLSGCVLARLQGQLYMGFSDLGKPAVLRHAPYAQGGPGLPLSSAIQRHGRPQLERQHQLAGIDAPVLEELAR